jgi:uncharacterized protein YceK
MMKHPLRVKSLFSFLAFLMLTGCATTGKHTAKKSKQKSGRVAGGYGLYDSRSLNTKILKRGKNQMASSALGPY